MTAEELEQLPRGDHASSFTQAELRAAAHMIMPEHEVESFMTQVHALGPGVFFYGDILSALSLVSPRAAQHVRGILGETEDQEKARLTGFRQRFPGRPA